MNSIYWELLRMGNYAQENRHTIFYKWAKEEQIYNCEKNQKVVKKSKKKC